MNYRDLNLFFCLACLVPLVLFGVAIRSYYDSADYLGMIVPISLSIITLLLVRLCYNRSRRNDNNGWIRV